jgi:hypothetical protein
MTTLAAAVEKLALERAKLEEKRTTGHLAFVPPVDLDVMHSVVGATGLTTLWFVFDFMLLHGTQSGSDWYTHFVFVGRAVVSAAGEVAESEIENRLEAHVTEYEQEWAPPGESYSHRAVRHKIGAAWWSGIAASLGR